MNLFLKIAVGGCILTSLFGNTVTVHVNCTNGQKISNLPISVIDSDGTEVTGVQPTDSDGNFQIENSEMYIAPFYMMFTAYDGSTCGNYYIEIVGNLGSVQLNYYPTDIPCSCVHLKGFH